MKKPVWERKRPKGIGKPKALQGIFDLAMLVQFAITFIAWLDLRLFRIQKPSMP